MRGGTLPASFSSEIGEGKILPGRFVPRCNIKLLVLEQVTSDGEGM